MSNAARTDGVITPTDYSGGTIVGAQAAPRLGGARGRETARRQTVRNAEQRLIRSFWRRHDLFVMVF
jgi:hypothetical protein